MADEGLAPRSSEGTGRYGGQGEVERGFRLHPQPTVTRYYQATLLDVPGSGAALSVVSVPQPADVAAELLLGASNRDEHWLLEQTARDLGVKDLRVIAPNVSDLLGAMLATRPDEVASYGGERGPIPWFEILGRDPDPLSTKDAFALGNYDPRLAQFVGRVAIEPLIPVESSPLGGVSLTALAKGAGTAAGGIALGMAAMSNPLILLCVPAGVIIMGGAKGIAQGLEEGLHARIVRMLTGQATPSLGHRPPNALKPAAPPDGEGNGGADA
jgi:hypothetical protein